MQKQADAESKIVSLKEGIAALKGQDIFHKEKKVVIFLFDNLFFFFIIFHQKTNLLRLLNLEQCKRVHSELGQLRQSRA